MAGPSKTQWHDVLSAKTGRTLDTSELQAWGAGLVKCFGPTGTDREEICDALHWAFDIDNAANWRKRSKYDYTEPWLRAVIYSHRKAQKQDTDYSGGECPLCGGCGWMGIAYTGELYDAYELCDTGARGCQTEHICCTCEDGERAGRNEHGPAYRELQQKAAAFKREAVRA